MAFQGIQRMGDFMARFRQIGNQNVADIGAYSRKSFFHFLCSFSSPGERENGRDGFFPKLRFLQGADDFPCIVDNPVHKGGIGYCQRFIDIGAVLQEVSVSDAVEGGDGIIQAWNLPIGQLGKDADIFRQTFSLRCLAHNMEAIMDGHVFQV